MKKSKIQLIIATTFIFLGLTKINVFATEKQMPSNPSKSLTADFNEEYEQETKRIYLADINSKQNENNKSINTVSEDSIETKLKLKKDNNDKSILASNYAKSKNDDSNPSTRASACQNWTGFNDQKESYFCGPASLMNAVEGYDIGNYGKYATYNPSTNTLKSQYDYAKDLNTKSGSWYELGGIGTDFSSRWVTYLNNYCPGNNYVLKNGEAANWDVKVKDAIVYTIDKDGGFENRNYNVVVNMNKDVTSDSIGGYYNHASAHYYIVYGYTNDGWNVLISDSNTRTGVPNSYQSSVFFVARDCQTRGIVW